MLFGAVVFLSALLLFQVQLIVSKHLLPWFGGTPAVWTTSQMFFQVLLLGGYAYAHGLSGIRRHATQYRVHLAVLAAASLALLGLAIMGGVPLLAPYALRPTAGESPTRLLLAILALSVGLPFFALSTTGPLLQRWHSRSSASIDSTYRLYALSNVGSFLALLSYPVVLERQLDLVQQAWLWSACFVLFAAGCATVARRSAGVQGGAESRDAEELADRERAEAGVSRVSPGTVAMWLLLSFVGSVAFLATTNQLTHDVAAVPFLWALPLAIYLLSFVICFDRPTWYSRRWMALIGTVTSLAVLTIASAGLDLPLQIVIYGAFLFSFCMLCHGEVVRLRPGARHLTLFYLLIAAGGALGGLFVSLVAPVIFNDFWEFQLMIPAGWMIIAYAWWYDEESPLHSGDRLLFGCLVAVVLLFVLRYAIERTPIGRLPWVAAHDWTVTLGAGLALGGATWLVAWRTRLARLPLWPRAMILVLATALSFLVWQNAARVRRGERYAARNFYGVVRVLEAQAGVADVRRLMHGSTVHGVEVDIPGRSPIPTAYYSPSTGIAIASTRLVRAGSSPGSEGVHFGVVGMGVGTMTAFAHAGDRVRYYEINPQVIDIAQGPLFSFISESDSDVTVVAGDARLSLERELREGKPQQFDLLAIDAFSSDAVPVHLITTEAFRLYASHLSATAILAVNVTNRYLDLEPVVAANARAIGFSAVRVDSPGDPPVRLDSSWILLSRNPEVTRVSAFGLADARPLHDEAVSFTDRYSNFFRVLK